MEDECSTPYAFADVSTNFGIPQENEVYPSQNEILSATEYTPSEITGSFFSANGVTLSSRIPIVIAPAQTLNLAGSVISGETKLYLMMFGTDDFFGSFGEADSEGNFSYSYIAPTGTGIYGFRLATTASDNENFKTTAILIDE